MNVAIKNRGEYGGSLLETAVMLTVIFAVVFWVVEVCGIMFTYSTIANAAEEGTRYGITRSGVVADDSRIITRVKNFAGISVHDVSQVSVSVTLPDGGSKPPNRIQVAVTYTYVPWLSHYVKNRLIMTAYAEGRMVVE
jgi:Flp pilus assembly protein TadG